MDKWGVVFCPKRKNSKKEWERFSDVLKKKHVEYDHVQSSENTGVMEMVRMFVDNNYHTIIIIGGDADLNDAVNCLMQCDVNVREKTALGVIPNGLLNDFARFWNLDEEKVEETIDALIRHRERRIDVGCIHYHAMTDEGEERSCKRYFINCVNVGLAAAITKLRRQTRTFFEKYIGTDPLSYAFSTLLLGFQRLEYKMRILINDDEIDQTVMTVCIGNGKGYGQTPSAVPYNGKLDVSIVSNASVASFASGAYLLLNNRFLNSTSVHPYRTEKVVFEKARHALVSVDGRILSTPKGEFYIDIEQETLNFLIP